MKNTLPTGFYFQTIPNSHTFTLYGIKSIVLHMKDICENIRLSEKSKLRIIESNINYLLVGIENLLDKSYKITQQSKNEKVKQLELWN